MRRALALGLLCAIWGCADAEDAPLDVGPRPDAMLPIDTWDQRLPDPDARASADAMTHEAPDAGRDGALDALVDALVDPIADARPRPDGEPGPTPEACAPLAVCGRTCADLQGDAQNCGGCGRTCAVRNGMPLCIAGACAVGACDPGFFDADGDPDNGCELESDCLPDAPCATVCDTEGISLCEDGMAICQPGPERCDALDQNCDGRCDEGPLPGCRRPIHRASGNGHIFTDDLAQAQRAPYRLEAQAFFHLYTADAQGMRAVFLCRKPNGRYFLTNENACEIGVAPERTIGYWSPRPLCDSIPLYRMYSPEGGNHFYTISAAERDNAVNNLGYLDEGTAGHVWRGP